MKKLNLLLTLFLSVITFAQNQRFTYEYRYTNSLPADSLRKEMVVLDVTKDGSKFYSLQKYLADSLMVASIQAQVKGGIAQNLKVNNSYKGSINYIVDKTYPKFDVYYNGGFLNSSTKFHVHDNRKMEWKILPDKEKIGEWDTQKAEVEFAGRKWTAWFSTEIPIQDGPYKFHGLPGLIVKLENEDSTHTYVLKGVKKFTPWVDSESKSTISGPISIMTSTKTIDLTQTQYAKEWEKFKLDPIADMRQRMTSIPSSGGGVVTTFRMTQNGKEVNPQDRLRNAEKSAKLYLQVMNNLIEKKLD